MMRQQEPAQEYSWFHYCLSWSEKPTFHNKKHGQFKNFVLTLKLVPEFKFYDNISKVSKNKNVHNLAHEDLYMLTCKLNLNRIFVE